MTTVILSKAEYRDSLSETVHRMLDQTVKDRVYPGARVLIKPNLLLPATPAHAILTHPLVVRAVAAWALEQGARVQVSDSPGIGSFTKILKDGGYLDVCRGMPITWAPFTRAAQKDIGPPFGVIDLAADALEADLVINLPKLKTHVMMGLTLGVKNMFGCIIGLRKTEWHLQAGIDRDLFARLLVQICRAVNPGVTLLDGVLALEGEGPGKGGTPRHLGILAASCDPIALDYVISRRVGGNPAKLPIHQAAVGLGFFQKAPEVVGEAPQVTGFRLPKMGSAGFGPESLQKLMRRHLLERPCVTPSLCRSCGICAKQCPAKAIRIKADAPVFDYDKCIRCYCCVEVCPYGALYTRNPLAGRMVRQVREWALRAIDKLRPPGKKAHRPH